MDISVAVLLAFESTGEKELSIDQIYRFIGYSISGFEEFGNEKLKRKITNYLKVEILKEEPIFRKSINPKTKKPKRQTYCILNNKNENK